MSSEKETTGECKIKCIGDCIWKMPMWQFIEKFRHVIRDPKHAWAKMRVTGHVLRVEGRDYFKTPDRDAEDEPVSYQLIRLLRELDIDIDSLDEMYTTTIGNLVLAMGISSVLLDHYESMGNLLLNLLRDCDAHTFVGRLVHPDESIVDAKTDPDSATLVKSADTETHVASDQTTFDMSQPESTIHDSDDELEQLRSEVSLAPIHTCQIM